MADATTVSGFHSIRYDSTAASLRTSAAKGREWSEPSGEITSRALAASRAWAGRSRRLYSSAACEASASRSDLRRPCIVFRSAAPNPLTSSTTLALFTRSRGAFAWPLPNGPISPVQLQGLSIE